MSLSHHIQHISSPVRHVIINYGKEESVRKPFLKYAYKCQLNPEAGGGSESFEN
jgi:hypothetical protein